jgi:hypothetical protein
MNEAGGRFAHGCLCPVGSFDHCFSGPKLSCQKLEVPFRLPPIKLAYESDSKQMMNKQALHHKQHSCY